MAKQMVFDDEARQPLAAGVAQARQGSSQHAGPPRPQRGARQGLGLAENHQRRRDRGRRHRAGRSVRKPGRNSSRKPPARPTTSPATAPPPPRFWPKPSSRRACKMIAAGADPMALSRGIAKATEAVIEAIKKMATPINEKNKKEIQQVATIAGNNDPDDRQRAGRSVYEGRQGWRDHRRRRPAERNRRSKSSKACSSTAAICRRTSSPIRKSRRSSWKTAYILIYEEKISNAKNLVPLLEADQQGQQAAADHRRRRRRRGPGDAGRQQDARHS